jgi:hypothetical protein
MIRILDKIKFTFSFPKYKIHQRLWIWGSCYMIIGIYRDWAFNVYCYECVGSEVNFTEGVIDFYQDEEKLDKPPLNVL